MDAAGTIIIIIIMLIYFLLTIFYLGINFDRIEEKLDKILNSTKPIQQEYPTLSKHI